MRDLGGESMPNMIASMKRKLNVESQRRRERVVCGRHHMQAAPVPLTLALSRRTVRTDL